MLLGVITAKNTAFRNGAGPLKPLFQFENKTGFMGRERAVYLTSCFNKVFIWGFAKQHCFTLFCFSLTLILAF